MKKQTLIRLLMFGVSLCILAYLFHQASGEPAFKNFRTQPKRWDLLFAGWLLIDVAFVLSIIRWFFLVRAIELPFRMRDAFRLGFLGYLFNFISPGNVGGDLFKAYFIAREHRNRRAEAVATVVVDRMIGLYGLFLVATICIISTNLWRQDIPQVAILIKATLACTVIGFIAIIMVLIPGFTQGAFSEFLSGLPKVGHTISSLINAVRMYRRRVGILILTVAMSLVIHCLVTIGVYFIGVGLPAAASPTFAEHFIIVPLAMVAGAIPILPMGLGVFDGAMDLLYVKLSINGAVQPGKGLIVALVYRLYTLLLALVGVPAWLTSRREVAEVMHEVEEGASLQFGSPTDGLEPT